MSHRDEIARMLTTLPRMMRFMSGDFTPLLDLPIKDAEIKTLIEIDQHPGRPMKFYVDAAGIETGSFTYLTDKLENKGLIRRMAPPQDKRKTVLELTAAGSQLTTSLRGQFDSHVQKKFDSLDESDIDRLAAAAMTMEAILKKLEKH